MAAESLCSTTQPGTTRTVFTILLLKGRLGLSYSLRLKHINYFTQQIEDPQALEMQAPVQQSSAYEREREHLWFWPRSWRIRRKLAVYNKEERVSTRSSEATVEPQWPCSLTLHTRERVLVQDTCTSKVQALWSMMLNRHDMDFGFLRFQDLRLRSDLL